MVFFISKYILVNPNHPQETSGVSQSIAGSKIIMLKSVLSSGTIRGTQTQLLPNNMNRVGEEKWEKEKEKRTRKMQGREHHMDYNQGVYSQG